MEYRYRIVGRTPGRTESEHYQGEVEANSAKQAIVKALAQEFGDSSREDPVEALTQSGWIDRETLLPPIYDLLDDDASFCLDTGEHTFDVEVVELSDADR